MKALVSIIIPTFNSGKTLKWTLKSIVDQTYSNIEVIIVDSGSTDDTLKIAREYNSKVIRINSRSRSIARYIGIKISKGNVIFLLDSDQIIPKDFIEIVVRKTLLDHCDVIATPTLILGNLLHSKGDLYRYFLSCISRKKIIPDFPRIFSARIKELILKLYPLVEYCEDRILFIKLIEYISRGLIKYCILSKPIFEVRVSDPLSSLMSKIRKAVYYGKWYNELRKTVNYTSFKVQEDLYTYVKRSVYECMFINKKESRYLMKVSKSSRITIAGYIFASCIYQLLSMVAFLVTSLTSHRLKQVTLTQGTQR